MNAVWNETLTFTKIDRLAEGKSHDVIISARDKDLLKDDEIGNVKIPLAELLHHQSQQREFELYDPKDIRQIAGRVSMTILAGEGIRRHYGLGAGSVAGFVECGAAIGRAYDGKGVGAGSTGMGTSSTPGVGAGSTGMGTTLMGAGHDDMGTTGMGMGTTGMGSTGTEMGTTGMGMGMGTTGMGMETTGMGTTGMGTTGMETTGMGTTGMGSMGSMGQSQSR